MDEREVKKEPSPEQKKLYNLYALFGVSLILCFIPYVSAAILCLVFFIWLMVAAYVARNKAEEHSLVHNHSVYIIRSLWVGAVITVITMLFASLYMFANIDYGAFNPCAESIAGKGIEALEAMGYGEFYEMSRPCIEDFIALNYNTLIIAVGIAAGLPLVYLAYRLFKGASRAMKGYRLPETTSWL